jgi:hypothetical protein
MYFKIGNFVKYLLVLAFLSGSIIGFMLKLPSRFRHYDKELHSGFYFLAALFLNVLFSKGKLLNHFLIAILLIMFGIGIELAQEYSNRFFIVKIHGRFDPEDIKANIFGLGVFTVFWLLLFFVKIFHKK